ncbi:hypothetical protein COT20_01005 [bacterium (Candidatus Gribaldobacteria) CG08_land_8_20_14_0_20_39_15]|uniref:Polymerase nucleotidyl transferase domain-containing protein n=1 Tax=bacterium (Candidatus Gribaldobacteria) CG08_land_8_20_14_0_20_39_15 TaxID=2014273 RepID=A0A2M6XUR5_9BACT|nr:MAG: hypothetical protein COT20_01005 [bacterium (Candidatus Gribaldobacteria) CG08_land_8_20_14_0_20_39_15]
MAQKRISKEKLKIVRTYIKRLSVQDKLPVSRVILFGSLVKGQQRKDSDIDICVISAKFKDGLKATQFLWKKRTIQEAMAGLEPVGFSQQDFAKGGSLIEEIQKTGIVVI